MTALRATPILLATHVQSSAVIYCSLQLSTIHYHVPLEVLLISAHCRTEIILLGHHRRVILRVRKSLSVCGNAHVEGKCSSWLPCESNTTIVCGLKFFLCDIPKLGLYMLAEQYA